MAATTHRPCSYPPSVAAAFEAPCTCEQVRVRVTVTVTVSGRVRMERVEAHLPNPIRQTPTPCTDAACHGRLATRRARARWVAAHSGLEGSLPQEHRRRLRYSSSCSAAGAELLAAAAAAADVPARLLGRWGPRVRERRRRRASLARTLPCTPAPTPDHPSSEPNRAGAEGRIEEWSGPRLRCEPSARADWARSSRRARLRSSRPRGTVPVRRKCTAVAMEFGRGTAQVAPGTCGARAGACGCARVRRTSSPDAVRSRAPASLHFRCPPLPRKSPRSLPLVPRPGSRAPGPRWPGRSR